MNDTLLFTPYRVAGLTLRNRIVLAPMLTYRSQHGAIGPWHTMHLGKFAAGGVGLVFMESTKVDPQGCTTANDPGLWSDQFIPSLRSLTDFLHHQGAATGIQLGHSGRKARNSLPWEGRKPLRSHDSLDDSGPWEIIGPSAIPHFPNGPVPTVMSREDIVRQLDMWGAAARRANEAGFDVLEVHCAHGYLLHQFLSPIANQRDDEYGGDLTNRMRFPIEVVRRVRDTWPKDKPLFVRVSSVDEGGWEIDDTIRLAQAFKNEGVDVLDCSAGGMGGESIVGHGVKVDYGYQVPYSAAVRKHANVATMAVGLIVHSDQAEQILRTGQADLIAIGRELLHNPNWALDAAIKLGIPDPYRVVEPSYGYWLRKRADAGFERGGSTWGAGMTGN